MATQSREPTVEEEQERGLLGQIEVPSIDWVPENERHGKLWHQLPLWFLGNFQYFSIPIGFVGPALGLSLCWYTILAGTLGILIGTVFMAFHATQGPTLGLPQMIQSRGQSGYRCVVIALFAVLFTYLAFNVTDQVLMAIGLNGTFGWNLKKDAIAIVTAIGSGAARHLRARLGASRLPNTALHPAATDDHHHHRRPHRACRIRAQQDRITMASTEGRPSWHSSPPLPPTTSPTRRTSRTTRATCPASRLPARSPDRLGVRRRVNAGHLADRARSVAGRPAGGDRPRSSGCRRPATTWSPTSGR